MLLGIASFSLMFHIVVSTCANYVSVQESTCQDIFEQLQNAIVENKVNLYNLRKVFYPTSTTEPTLVNVSYNLNMTIASNESCPGDTATLLNSRIDVNVYNVTGVQTNVVWTSKIFYTLFHPATINRIQPQLMQQLLVVLDSLYTRSTIPTALTWNTTGPILTVELYLTFELACLPTLGTLQESLHDITSVVSDHIHFYLIDHL